MIPAPWTQLTPVRAWDLADRVGHAYALLADAMSERLVPHAVPAAEVIAMTILHATPGPVSQTEWGRLQGVSRQRAHVVANTLGDRGWVAQERRGRDQLVQLTPEGRHVVEMLREELGAMYAVDMEPLGPGNAAALYDLLGRLIAVLQASRVSASEGRGRSG
ncbi:MAG: MarR family winged helix-turn-helix transcriptional regulator [Dehalococcoidia bacterium]